MDTTLQFFGVSDMDPTELLTLCLKRMSGRSTSGCIIFLSIVDSLSGLNAIWQNAAPCCCKTEVPFLFLIVRSFLIWKLISLKPAGESLKWSLVRWSLKNLIIKEVMHHHFKHKFGISKSHWICQPYTRERIVWGCDSLKNTLGGVYQREQSILRINRRHPGLTISEFSSMSLCTGKW